MPDEGYVGSWALQVISTEMGEYLRDVVGPPTYQGQKMVSINLQTFEWKWQTAQRSFSKRPTYTRRRK